MAVFNPNDVEDFSAPTAQPAVSAATDYAQNQAQKFFSPNDVEELSVPQPSAQQGQSSQLGFGPVEKDISNQLDWAAEKGKKFNELIQKAIGNAAEAGGRTIGPTATNIMMAPELAVAGTAAKYLIPQSKEAVAAALMPTGLEGAPTKELAVSKSLPYEPPNFLQKALGSIMGAKTGMKADEAAEIIRDPSIVGPGTPDKQTVGKMYEDFYGSLGLDTTSQKYKELFGSAYPAGERQLSKLKNIAESTANEYAANPQAVQTEQLIFARQAARKIREAAGSMDPRTASVAGGHYDMFDSALQDRGLEGLKKIDSLYKRASIAENASALLPTNKSGSVNALRSNVGMLLLGDAAKDLAQGNLVPAGIKGAQALSMSPLLATQAVAKSAQASRYGTLGAAVSTANPLLQFLRKDNEGGR